MEQTKTNALTIRIDKAEGGYRTISTEKFIGVTIKGEDEKSCGANIVEEGNLTLADRLHALKHVIEDVSKHAIKEGVDPEQLVEVIGEMTTEALTETIIDEVFGELKGNPVAALGVLLGGLHGRKRRK